jgi:RNA polymerase sigma-70 factor (ECF subfamily)
MREPSHLSAEPRRGDAVTVTAAAHERDAAFDRQVTPELPRLRAFALSLARHEHDADDLLQETLIRAHRGVHRFDGRHPRAWLYTIMRNSWINECRRRRARPVEHFRDIDEAFTSDPYPAPDDLVTEQVMDTALADALEALPGVYRLVVDAVILRGARCGEAAEDLSLPVGTVLSRLHRARNAMRAELDETSRRRSAA